MNYLIRRKLRISRELMRQEQSSAEEQSWIKKHQHKMKRARSHGKLEKPKIPQLNRSRMKQNTNQG